MRHFGYFMTESTGHLSEYLPWFRSSQRALQTYCDEPAFGGESGAYYKFSRMLDDKYHNVDYLASESPRLGVRSVEYCSYILEAHQTRSSSSMAMSATTGTSPTSPMAAVSSCRCTWTARDCIRRAWAICRRSAPLSTRRT
jgi:hypothetical protein